MAATHSLAERWSKALDTYIAAEKRYREAQLRGDKGVAAFKLDRDKALEAYDLIAAEID